MAESVYLDAPKSNIQLEHDHDVEDSTNITIP